ncbi:MAG TPA: hypothetical protein VFJ47_14010 [Terriglobales bacterium]|nr:hypothetical protein [Terriglobales bacterium]
MFEQELEMEKRNSSVVPLLLIVVLILSIVGVAVYYLLQSRQVLGQSEAQAVVVASLKYMGPVTIHFETGLVKASVEEKPRDPNYRLLEKAGLITLGKDKGWKTPVTLTPKGRDLFANIAGVSKSKDKDGADIYIVPIAERKLAGISKITMTGTGRATVEYSWKWETNQLGELFDASGALVKGFNTWDRATLISKYGANFYHGEPTRVALALVKGDKGWQIAVE